MSEPDDAIAQVQREIVDLRVSLAGTASRKDDVEPLRNKVADLRTSLKVSKVWAVGLTASMALGGGGLFMFLLNKTVDFQNERETAISAIAKEREGALASLRIEGSNQSRAVQETRNAASGDISREASSAIAEVQRRADGAVFVEAPIGSVLSYSGALLGSERDAVTTSPEQVTEDLVAAGWLLCDGKELRASEYPRLHSRIGNRYGGREQQGVKFFNLPDYRGVFIRGVNSGRTDDGRDPDAGTRLAKDGSTGDRVGTLQADATALPKNGFRTATDGAHRHTWPGTGYETGPGKGGGASLNGHWIHGDHKVKDLGLVEGGDHHHEVNVGGDNETRPKNMSVHWLIRGDAKPKSPVDASMPKNK